MAEQEHVAVLRRGVDVWNEWIAARRGACGLPEGEAGETGKASGEVAESVDCQRGKRHVADLSGLRLRGEDVRDTPLWDGESARCMLHGIDLRGVDLSLAVIEDTDMSGARLERAVLRGATLMRVKLKHASCRGMSLANTFLEHVDMRGVDLEHAMLTEARIRNSSLKRASLADANATLAEISDTKLTNACLDRAQLVRAVVTNTPLAGASLREADLREVRFTHVDIRGAHLTGARLAASVWREVNGVNADLSGADCVGADLRGTVLREGSLKGSDLRAVDLRRVDLRRADVRGANVARVRYNRYGLFRGVRLDGCYGGPGFLRFARDQEYLEEVRGDRDNWRYWLLYLPWLISSDCGRSLGLWSGWSLLLALGFGVRFWVLGPEHFEVTRLGFSLLTMCYYSVVTFTTLGFGDVVPTTSKAAAWVTVEVIVGYVMLGGLIAIFSNKLARRS